MILYVRPHPHHEHRISWCQYVCECVICLLIIHNHNVPVGRSLESVIRIARDSCYAIKIATGYTDSSTTLLLLVIFALRCRELWGKLSFV